MASRTRVAGCALACLVVAVLAGCTEPTASWSDAWLGPPLTDVELNSITWNAWIPIPDDAPAPIVDASAAEVTVRMTYSGPRQTIEVRRIAMRIRDRVQVGWVVALTPRAGVPCVNHPGLQPRAYEGGIVDDQTGDMFCTMTCF